MPPGNQSPFDPTDLHRPSETVREGVPIGHTSSSVGPTVGIIIILVLLIMGALYFWGARLNRENLNNPPFIPADNSTTIAQ